MDDSFLKSANNMFKQRRKVDKANQESDGAAGVRVLATEDPWGLALRSSTQWNADFDIGPAGALPGWPRWAFGQRCGSLAPCCIPLQRRRGIHDPSIPHHWHPDEQGGRQEDPRLQGGRGLALPGGRTGLESHQPRHLVPR
jgi:hypothetical protein